MIPYLHMDFKVCSKCFKKWPVAQYSWKNRKKNYRHSFCKACQAAYRRAHYLKNKEKYLNKARNWNRKQTEVLRRFIVKYLKEHVCVDCGKGDIRVLDFDHESEKRMGIARMIRNCHSVRSLEQEISKCKVRCANCHRIKSATRGNYWKNKIGL